MPPRRVASCSISLTYGSRLTRVHNGDPGPLLPVELSGLLASRQIGLPGTRLVSGLFLHEQLTCHTSSNTVSFAPIVTVSVAPPVFGKLNSDPGCRSTPKKLVVPNFTSVVPTGAPV